MQELHRTRERSDRIDAPYILLGVDVLHSLQDRGIELAACLSCQGVDEQAAAHSDAAVDFPYRQLDAGRLQPRAPGNDMLVHTIDERPVEVEDDGGHRTSSRPLSIVRARLVDSSIVTGNGD